MEHNEREIEEGANVDEMGAEGDGGGEMPHEDLLQDAPEGPEHHGSVGAIIGVIIVVLVISLAGLYFWGSKMQHKQDMPREVMQEDVMENDAMMEEKKEPVDEMTEELSQQSSSDNADDIEDDLLGTDLDNLDLGLDDIEAELGAAIGEL